MVSLALVCITCGVACNSVQQCASHVVSRAIVCSSVHTLLLLLLLLLTLLLQGQQPWSDRDAAHAAAAVRPLTIPLLHVLLS